MSKFHVEMLGNSEVLKSRSIKILPEVDRLRFFHFHVCSSSFCGVLSHGRLELSTKVEDETSPLMTLTLLYYYLHI
jgi:hypothetical protein